MRLFLFFPATPHYVMGQEEKMNLEHYEIEGLEKPSEIKKKLEC